MDVRKRPIARPNTPIMRVNTSCSLADAPGLTYGR